VKEENRRRIDIVSEPGFTAGLDSLDLDELRERRDTCSDLDIELSYYRRLLHGRMDLLAFEMRRRAGDESESIIDALPRILSEGAYSKGGPAQRAVPIEVPELPLTGRRLVDRALDDDYLLRLPSLTDEELQQAQVFVSEVEVEVSQQRRRVHSALDHIQAEVASRYGADAGAGEASRDA
jgi:hypothetical protein